ncbi:YdhK family protein [Eupransor demetentiae]|uniref:LysM repeat (LysM) n=1 Tax=Eupransor demetentiae TaxID=3109584 RepID=A0ABP0ENX1_9LACO|nr:LysM repeat (LysM) [Lactobacillaceae bacterium LMG 33000]
MSKKVLFSVIAAVLVVAAGAWYFTSQSHKNDSSSKMSSSMSMSSSMKMSSGMKMKTNGTLPTGLAQAQDPKYKVGQDITLEATHMAGMKGAKGTVAAVYDAKLYEVDFKSTDGMEVKNHKWLTKVDFKDGMDHKAGDKVTIESDHMSGMKGAKGTVVKVVDGPAYAVNFQPTNGGKEVTNHLYLAEDEIEAR